MVSILGRIIGCDDKHDVRLTRLGLATVVSVIWLVIGISILAVAYLGDVLRIFWELEFVSRVAIVFILPALIVLAIDIWGLFLFGFDFVVVYRVGDRDG